MIVQNYSFLDTSVQPAPQKSFNKETLVDVRLAKRIKRKQYTQRITAELLKLDSKLHKEYKRAFYCCNGLQQEGRTLKTTNEYCNSRACLVCNSIRTAKLIDAYGTMLKAEKQYFCTLTIVNVKKAELKQTIEKMTKQFGLILKSVREKKGLKPDGIRRLEITYNKESDTYHPHFHYLINCKKSAELIKSQWLKRYPTAKPYCQDVREANEDTLVEIFKYSTKYAVKQAEHKDRLEIHPESLDAILCSLNGKRTVQPFGKYVKQKISEEITAEDIQEQEYNIKPRAYAKFEWRGHDYFEIYTGEALTGSQPITTEFICVGKAPPKQMMLYFNTTNE
jgi:hypothetical protein